MYVILKNVFACIHSYTNSTHNIACDIHGLMLCMYFHMYACTDTSDRVCLHPSSPRRR